MIRPMRELSILRVTGGVEAEPTAPGCAWNFPRLECVLSGEPVSLSRSLQLRHCGPSLSTLPARQPPKRTLSRLLPLTEGNFQSVRGAVRAGEGFIIAPPSSASSQSDMIQFQWSVITPGLKLLTLRDAVAAKFGHEHPGHFINTAPVLKFNNKLKYNNTYYYLNVYYILLINNYV